MWETMRLFVHQGGFTAWLIIGAAVLLIVIGGERLFYLFVVMSYRSEKALEEIRKRIMSRNYTDAIQICTRQSRAPELQVIKHGLLAVENGREAMKSALGSVLLDVSRRCEMRIAYIALIASSATLLGLLGTITGLIKTFSAMAEADPSTKAKMLGAGISEAMYSTACGLSVGLAAMVVHTLSTSRIDRVLGKAQDAGLKLMTWIEQSERSAQNG